MRKGVEVVVFGDKAIVTPLDASLIREVAKELVAVGGQSVKVLTGGAAYGFEMPLTVAQEAGFAPLGVVESAPAPVDEVTPEIPAIEVSEPRKRAPRKAAAKPVPTEE